MQAIISQILKNHQVINIFIISSSSSNSILK